MSISRLLRRISTVRIYWRRKKWWSILSLLRRPIQIDTLQGAFKIYPSRSNFIAKELYVNRAFELDLSTRAMQVCRELNGESKGKGKILDIGANTGVISLGMLTRGELDEAICIEPDLTNFQQMKVNRQLNGLETKMTCFNYALSDHSGELEFELSHLDQGDHRVRMNSLTHLEENEESLRKTTIVQGEKLDALISNGTIDAEGLSVIWLDTQGFEGYILKGAQQLLKKDIPVVCELSPYLLLRAGMPLNEYVAIVSQSFKQIWVQHDDDFRKQPIEHINALIESLGTAGQFTDVIYY